MPARVFYHGVFRPHDTLRGVVENYWVTQAERCRTAVEAALADASVEIYFNLGPAGRHLFDGSAAPRLARRTAWVVGPHAGTLLVAKETRACDIVGVRLRPGTAADVLGVPAMELGDTLIDLDQLWGARAGELVERLAATDDDSARVGIVEQAMVHRLSRRTSTGDMDRMRALCESVGTLATASVADVAHTYGLSHRKVIALFDRHVGLKPKAFHRVRRLRTVLEMISRAERPSWAQVAAHNGYCDQAHLIHEFRKLTGLTPREYEAMRTSIGHGFVPYRLAAGGRHGGKELQSVRDDARYDARI